jgi:F0F1-type ATP synthase membrane subunit b/b'
LLEQRRKKIQAGIDNTIKADEKLSKLKEIKVNMEKQNERDRVSILAKAQSEGKKRKNQIIKDAEDEKMAILAKAKKEAEDIKQREADLTKKRIIDNAILLTEELLKENIDKDKGKKISEDFLSKIKI